MSTPGRIWRTGFPPQAQWQTIPPKDARALFRRVFQQWGLPRTIRVDNGHPWGLNRGLPPALALWLIGLGVSLEWIPPGQPQQNGHVERGNGVTQQWAEPQTCSNRAQLQARLNHECEVQRERYPSVAGMSRAEAYPDLRHSDRPYRPKEENGIWDLANVDRFMAELTMHRWANAQGTISLYGEGRNLGRAHAGKEVRVRFDARLRQWVVTDLQSQELKRFPAPELSRDRILALKVGQTHGRGQMSKKGV
jgi:hypothetical protein